MEYSYAVVYDDKRVSRHHSSGAAERAARAAARKNPGVLFWVVDAEEGDVLIGYEVEGRIE